MVKKDNTKYSIIYEQKLKTDSSDVILDCKKGSRRFHNFSTGKSGTMLEQVIRDENEYVVLNFSQSYRTGYFVEYNEQFDVLVIRIVEFDTTRYPEENEIRTWQRDRLCRCFVHERTGNTFFYGGRCVVPDFSVFNHAVDVYYSSRLADSPYHVIKSFGHKKTESIMRTYLGEFICFKALRFTRVSCCNLSNILNRGAGVVTSKQKEIQHLIDVDMGDISDNSKNTIYSLVKLKLSDEIKRFNTDENYSLLNHSKEEHLYESIMQCDYNFACIVKTIDGVSCIRQFKAAINLDFLGSSNVLTLDDFNIKLYEILRIYITDNDFFACKNYSGKWIKNKTPYLANYFCFILVDVDKESLETTRLKYYSGGIKNCIKQTKYCLKDASYKNFLKAQKEAISFFAMVSSPIYESLVKSEYSCFRDIVFDNANSSMNIDSLLKEYFGDYDETKNSFTKAVGVPSHVFKTIDKYYQLVKENKKFNYNLTSEQQQICSSIRFFKKVFSRNKDYFQRIDDKTFDGIMELRYKLILNKKYYYFYDSKIIGCLRNLISLCGTNNILSYLEQLYKIMEFKDISYTIARWSTRTYLDLYADYVHMYYIMKALPSIELPPIDYKLQTEDDVTRAHDNIVTLYNLRVDEKNLEKMQVSFDSHSDRWKKFEYQEEEFVVVAPSKVEEVVKEGIVLRHCVKSYLQFICDGLTNILFIRKVDDLDTPFFTLEVRDNEVRQCHGFANCNIDVVDGLDEFLKRFCKERKIVYSSGYECRGV